MYLYRKNLDTDTDFASPTPTDISKKGNEKRWKSEAEEKATVGTVPNATHTSPPSPFLDGGLWIPSSPKSESRKKIWEKS